MNPDVVVVGAGCAGLAAATAVAEAGGRVAVVEARRRIGGRSRSWIDPVTGDVEDNGQHILLACYREFLGLVERIGSADEIVFQDALEIVQLHRDGRRSVLRRAGLPGALGLAVGLLRFRGFPVRDLAALRGVIAEARRGGPPPGGESAAAWLARHRQTARSRALLWDPLLLATLNVPPEEGCASLFGEVLRRSLLAEPGSSRVGFPRSGLGSLLVDPALRFLEGRGARVSLGDPVTAVETARDGRFSAVVTRSGARLAAGAAVFAAPHEIAARLLPPGAVPGAPDRLARLGRSAILGIHLWFDRRVLAEPMVGFVRSPVHWAFARGRGNGYVALVTSAADDLASRSSGEIVDLARGEVEAYLPLARGARLLRSRVVRERAATPRLGTDRVALRPPVRSGVRCLALAGDWVDSGLPSTLEAAAATGHEAARAVAGAGGW